MKFIRFLALITALLLIGLPALAETYYVYTPNGKSLNLRSPQNNAVIGNIPYGTKLETNDALSTETAAYVNWGGKAGYVKWSYLVKDPPPSLKGEPAPTEAPTALDSGETKNVSHFTTVELSLLPADGEGEVTIQTYGAYIQYTLKSKSTPKYSAISYDEPVKLKVTADPPSGKTVEYWVIDGVRYDFKPRVPATFTVENATDSIIIEAVCKGEESLTLLSPSAIEEMITGETLIVDTIHARLCHIREDDKGAGGWLTSFDFTEDYMNRATKQPESGGQVTVRVKATVPKGKTIAYWKFDDVHIDFDKNITEMIVRSLNVSKTYEPVFIKKTTNQQQPPRPAYGTTLLP